jgi:hypothetical protein
MLVGAVPVAPAVCATDDVELDEPGDVEAGACPPLTDGVVPGVVPSGVVGEAPGAVVCIEGALGLARGGDGFCARGWPSIGG